MDSDKEFLEYVIKSIISEGEKVTINRTVDERGVLLTLEGVSKDDMKRVIGKGGHTVNAIRTLLRVIGMKNNARVNLKVLEPEGSEHQAEHRDAGANMNDMAPRPQVTSSSVDQAMEDLKGI